MLGTRESVLAIDHGPRFIVTDWLAPVDLGAVTAEVVSYVLLRFIMSDAFASDNSNGVRFPSAPKNIFLAHKQEQLMEVFKKCLF